MRTHESAIKGTWEEVLGCAEVSMESNFFALGGTSLQAAKVILRLNRLLKTNLPLTAMFEAPLLEDFCGVVELEVAKCGSTSEPHGARSEPHSEMGSLLPAPLAVEYWHSVDPNTWSRMAPLVCIAWRVRGNLDLTTLGLSYRRVVESHDALRMKFCQSAHGVAVTIEQDPIADPVREVVADEALSVDVRIQEWLAAVSRPSSIPPGSVQRLPMEVLRLGQDDYAIALTVSHLICDGVGARILENEVWQWYTYLVGGGPRPQRPLMQFSQWVVEQRRRFTAGRKQEICDFLQRTISPGPEELRIVLPGRLASSAVFSADAVEAKSSSSGFEISVPDARALKASAASNRTTLFAILAGAMLQLLQADTGRTVLFLRTTIANRGIPNSETMIGWCSSSIWVRTDLAGCGGVREVSQRFQRSFAEAVEHGDVPIGPLIREIWPESSPYAYDHVYFAMQQADTDECQALPAGLKVEDLSVGGSRADPGLQVWISDKGTSVSVRLTAQAGTMSSWYLAELADRYRILLLSER